MKLLYKVLAAIAGILALSSCVEDAIAPLTGKYEKPVEYVMTDLVSQSVEKGEKIRTFTVELAGDNASLNMKFVGSKYFLEDAAYNAAPADAAKAGNYIVGNGGSTFTLGGNTVNVNSGSLIVAQVDGKYTFNGNLWLADESIVNINATAALVYEPDPEPVVMSTVLMAQSNVQYGVNTVTVQLAQEGIYSEFDMTTYQNIWYGEGNYMAIDLYSADGFLHEGTYTANSVGGVVGEGQFGIGYDTTVDYGWGPMEMKDYGTCWWTVANGAATAQKILDGTVTVTKKGSKWEIELISGEGKDMIWGKFTGAIEALTDGGGSTGGDDTDYTELSTLISAQSNIANGTKSLTINMATDGVTATLDMTTFQMVYGGTGNYLALDIYSADGKLYTGTYNASAVGGAIAEGEFGIGWDPGDLWGIGMIFENWGTCWWTVTDGVTSAEKVIDGTVEVAVEGDNLVIKAKTSLVNAQFTYPVADFKDSYGNAIEVVNLGGGGEPEIEYTPLVNLVSAQSNVANGTKSLTINMATDGVTATLDMTTYQMVYGGTGNYLALDIYSADGKLYTGTYNASAVGGAIAEGEFGIGWDPGDLWGIGMIFENWGTCWWTVTDGTTSAEKIDDGTVDVAVEGDNLVISVQSTLVNAQFTYPVADFKDSYGNVIEVVK